VRAYLDTLAEPDVPTVCFGTTRVRNADGSTRPVRVGETRTIEQCRALLREDLVTYWQGYRAALTPDAVATALTPQRDAAFTSLTWNIGVRAAARSTAVRMLNEQRIAAACESITWWNKSGGRVYRGLVDRRAEERDLCLEGLA
jgi:GH24 family phage-related lysozyme (muramidase)